MINTQDLATVVGELAVLSGKRNWTKADEHRAAYLKVAQACIRDGMSLDEFRQQHTNDVAASTGLPTTQFNTSSEFRKLYNWIKTGIVNEQRTETVGVGPVVQLNGGIGTFVPMQFFNKVIAAMAQHSPLFDEANVTFLRTDKGGLMQLPWLSDVENVATIIGEGVQDTSDTSIDLVGGVNLQTFTFRSPRVTLSYEADQDVPNLESLLADRLADRLARGVGAKLLNGAAGYNLTGLLPTVIQVGAIVLASGSSANDGSGNTSNNSIGAQDLATLFLTIPAPYRSSPKFAWLMNSTTLLELTKLIDKQGQPLLNLSQGLTLYGKKILIDENMPNIAHNQVPVLAGDFSYFVVQAAGQNWLKRYWQASGLVEFGKYGLALFGRYGAALAFNDIQNSPIWGLQNVTS